MPNGVNIIETIPITTNYFMLNLAWLISVLYFFIGVFLICKFSKKVFSETVTLEESNSFASMFVKISLGAVILVFLSLTISLIYKPDYTGENQYRVEITDSAFFNEVYDNYEILEQDENVYLIEEKELKGDTKTELNL